MAFLFAFLLELLSWLTAPATNIPNLHYVGGTMVMTGYFTTRGVYQFQEINRRCYGDWRHARVGGLHCSYAVAQQVGWHAFAGSVGVAGGEVVRLWMEEAKVDRPITGIVKLGKEL
ncbi:hypothetical protein BDZ85DRAFT_253795 [Elsinoe ampelina]|uniref:Uncharacterized protein n=1 Tax=Elsinoe ampelina TaxID=302913 RepID=A0A6A6FXV6_9PEZI|nr:hypothetical protein BDZ85DRAFT_253795 [Elsinoe ampelina]